MRKQPCFHWAEARINTNWNVQLYSPFCLLLPWPFSDSPWPRISVTLASILGQSTKPGKMLLQSYSLLALEFMDSQSTVVDQPPRHRISLAGVLDACVGVGVGVGRGGASRSWLVGWHSCFLSLAHTLFSVSLDSLNCVKPRANIQKSKRARSLSLTHSLTIHLPLEWNDYSVGQKLCTHSDIHPSIIKERVPQNAWFTID